MVFLLMLHATQYGGAHGLLAFHFACWSAVLGATLSPWRQADPSFSGHLSKTLVQFDWI